MILVGTKLDPKFSCKRASDRIEAFRNRRCYEVEPFGVALGLGTIDPITGLPGMSLGTIAEVLGPEGSGKTAFHEHAGKHILSADPENEIFYLFFEPPHLGRMQALEAQGLDMNRVHYEDYSAPEAGQELASAEEGLNLMLNIAKESPQVKMCVIDSLGAMAVGKELYDDKGEFKALDTTPQMAVRASKVTMFINQWLRLDPNTRPILIMINHYKIPIEPSGPAAFKHIIIGENLKHNTPCGKAKSFAADIRIKLDSKRVDLDDGKTKHKLFTNKIQTGLEIHYDIFKNKNANQTGSRKIIGKFDFKTASFDIIEEVLSYADYLGIDGITKGTTGRYTIPSIDDKTRSLKQVKEVVTPEMINDLKRKIAPRHNELFSCKIEEKKKTADKEL